jgi:hypothetical protein
VATLNLIIDDGANDGYYSTAGSFDFTGTEGRMGVSGPFSYYGGWRYIDVTIPQGATITSAILTFMPRDTQGQSSVARVRIEADDVDNAAAWSSPSSRPDQITPTTAHTDIQGPITNGVLYTADVTAVVQEIVNRAGWASGNSIRFAGKNNAGDADKYLQFATFEFSILDAAFLDIDYEEAAPPEMVSDVSRKSIWGGSSYGTMALGGGHGILEEPPPSGDDVFFHYKISAIEQGIGAVSAAGIGGVLVE